MVQASIIRFENCIDAYKIKDELAYADHLVIQRLIKKFETLDTEFHQYHYTLVELQENEADVEEEQVVLDHHDEKVTDIIDRLYQLVLVPKKVFLHQ